MARILNGTENPVEARLRPRMARRRWRAAVALAAAALALLLLRPFCDFAFAIGHPISIATAAMAAAHGEAAHVNPTIEPSESCCAIATDGTLLTSAEMLIRGGADAPLIAVLLVSSSLLLFARARDPARRLFAVLPERSFYARSARILR